MMALNSWFRNLIRSLVPLKMPGSFEQRNSSSQFRRFSYSNGMVPSVFLKQRHFYTDRGTLFCFSFLFTGATTVVLCFSPSLEVLLLFYTSIHNTPLSISTYSSSGRFLSSVQTDILSPCRSISGMEMIFPGILVLAIPYLVLLSAKTGELIFLLRSANPNQICKNSEGILICLEDTSVSQYNLTGDLKLKKIRSFKVPFLHKGAAFISSMQDGRVLILQESTRNSNANVTIYNLTGVKLSHVRKKKKKKKEGK